MQAMLSQYFGWAKGGGDAGDLLASCPTVNDMPEYVRTTLEAIKNVIEPPTSQGEDAGATPGGAEAVVEADDAAVPTNTVLAAPTYVKFQPHPPKPLA
jgi:putative ATP-dependent endonuclease of OLD family